jgi:hypothetical protein
MIGFFTQYRHRLAWLASGFPGVTRLLSIARWWMWTAAGWPLTTMVVFLVVGVVGTGSALIWVPLTVITNTWSVLTTVVLGWPAGRDGVFVTGGVIVAVALFRWWLSVRLSRSRWMQRRDHGQGFGPVEVAIACGIAWLTVNIGIFALTVGPVVVLALFLTASLMIAADQVLPFMSRRFGLLRRVCEFRRELPSHWTDLAARSDRIQGIDVSVERTVSETARSRPILEHPALGGLWTATVDVDGFAVEFPIARPEGRTFEALTAVLDELAAQYLTVGDWPGSITLVDVVANSASLAVLRVEFIPPSLRGRPNRATRPGLADVIDLRTKRRVS